MDLSKYISTTLELDEDGYPTEQTLVNISKWPVDRVADLLPAVKPLWMYADYGYWAEKANGITRIATAGWSGNEIIIRALKNNWVFWHLYWLMSKRGGLYLFQDPQVRLNILQPPAHPMD